MRIKEIFLVLQISITFIVCKLNGYTMCPLDTYNLKYTIAIQTKYVTHLNPMCISWEKTELARQPIPPDNKKVTVGSNFLYIQKIMITITKYTLIS